MRVLFINRAMGMFRGGGETYALNIAKELKNLGCEIQFITSKPLFGKAEYPVEEFETEYVSSPYLRDFAQRMLADEPRTDKLSLGPIQIFFQKGYRFIIRKIYNFDDLKSQNDIFNYLKKRRKNYDVVQIFSHSVLASRIIKKLGIPVVIRFPGPPSVKNIKNILSCNAVVANGDAVRMIRDTISKDVIDIPPGIDSQKFKPAASDVRAKYNLSPNDKILLFVGRFVPLKNLPFLIKATAELIKYDSTIKLLLAGDGPLYIQITKLVSELKIKDSVFFLGKIANEDLTKYYSAADIFVITSNYDNFPNVVIEAMACGLPVIGTKVGGLSLQVENGKNGFLVDNNNIREFKEAALKLVNNRSLCDKIGKRNMEMVKEKYNWLKSAKSFLGIYEGILKR